MDETCTPEELAMLQRMLKDPAYGEQLEALLGDAWHDDVAAGVPPQDERSAEDTLRRILAHDRKTKSVWLKRWHIAAAMMVVVGFSTLLYLRSKQGTEGGQPVASTPLDADPGTYKAELSYDGEKPLSLRTSQQGIIMTEKGASYMDGTGLDIPGHGKRTADNYYELHTPRGGSYQITLPDGTRVWLNAQTTLRYPARFAADARTVILTGEAYFDVAEKRDDRGQPIPFSVITDRQHVHVLGTEFNLTAYPDETMTTTTLIEGRVRVERPAPGDESDVSAVTLSPGQEAIASAGNDRLIARAAENSFAGMWREGIFVFNNEPLGKMLQRLGRWYDVDVSYRGGAEHIRFTGNYAMNKSLRSLLEHITLTEGIRFEMAGNSTDERRIIAIKD